MADKQPPQDPKPPEKKVLKGKAALGLWHQGKDAWNQWAETHEGWGVNFSGVTLEPNADKLAEGEYIDFEDFVFPGTVYFAGARFTGKASFIGATFTGLAYFAGVTFTGETNFAGVTFEKSAVFDHSTFENTADFFTTDFKGPLGLAYTQFDHVPDFRYAKFETLLSLHGVVVNYQHHEFWAPLLWYHVRRAANRDDVVKYRRLKELAKKTEDHKAEQLFFAYELKAERMYSLKLGVPLALNYLYQLFSDFGHSVARPFLYLIASWLIFSGVYLLKADQAKACFFDALLNAMGFSASQLVPFLGAAKGIGESAKTALFGSDYPGWLSPFMMLEGVIGLAFIFLIGLGLRNMFRI